ncbi:MAG TPA: hypothetical protein PKE66_09030 [Pyrinomonadaceae bacterium]|nr:hypothetical protein [Pyrinomonadaceae bacterium]
MAGILSEIHDKVNILISKISGKLTRQKRPCQTMSKPIDYSQNPSLIQERSGGQFEGWWSPLVKEATVTGGFPEHDRAISAKSRTGAVEL